MATLTNGRIPAHPNLLPHTNERSLDIFLDFSIDSPMSLRRMNDNGDFRYDITFLENIKHYASTTKNVRLNVRFLPSYVEKDKADILNDQAQIIRHAVMEITKFQRMGAFEGSFEMPGRLQSWGQLRNAAYFYKISPEVAWSFRFKVGPKGQWQTLGIGSPLDDDLVKYAENLKNKGEL